MSEYCLDENGTAANKAAALGGAPTDLATCMNVAVHNAESFAASDVIQLSDNNEITSTIVPPTAGVQYTAYPGDSPIINPGAASSIDINVTGLEIDNIELKGGSTGQIDANNAAIDSLIVHDCHFNTPATFGLFLQNTENAEVYNCTGASSTSAGIIADNAGNVNLIIHDNTMDGCETAILTKSDGTEVYDNVITNGLGNAARGIQVHGDAKIHDNVVQLAADYASITTSHYGIYVAAAAADPEIYNNKCFYCFVGFRSIGLGNFHHNLSYLNGTNGFDATGAGSAGAQFYNNVSIFNRNHQFVQQSGASGAIFKNNIGWADGTVPTAVSPNTECFAFVQVVGDETVATDNNCWIITNPGVGVTLCRFWEAGGTDYKETELSAWQTLCAGEADITGGDANSIAKGATVGIDETSVFTDVTIADRTDYDFSLKKGSPCIQVGDNAVWSGTANVTDYIGTSITDGAGTIDAPGGVVDMGAYEYVAVPSVGGIGVASYGRRQYEWLQYAKL